MTRLDGSGVLALPEPLAVVTGIASGALTR